jgi:trafficking protein particle complex subunit 5
MILFVQRGMTRASVLRRLDQMGFDVGQRFLELTFAREKSGKRETKVVNLLQFISTNMWKTLFGKKADGVEKSKEHDNVCKSV